MGIYAPAQAKFRPGFFGEMGKGLGRLPLDCDLVICLGDFNCVEDKALDRTCMQNQISEDIGTKDFLVIKQLLHLKDAYREGSPEGREFSFFSKQHKTQSRIDRIYCNQVLLDCLHSTSFKTVGFSDHRLVSAKFMLLPLVEPRGSSYWKLNTLLLKDEAFLKLICNEIQGKKSTAVLERPKKSRKRNLKTE